MNDEIAHLQELRATHRRNIRELERRLAAYGSLERPLKLINELEDEKKTVARLEKELEFLVSQLQDIATAQTEETISPQPIPCPRPFKRGLTPYEVEDKDIFCGREKETERLVAHIQQGRLTVVVGWSGCGKSSLIKAGVIPRLRKQGYPVVYAFVLNRITENVLNAVKRELASDEAMPNLATALDRLHKHNPAVPVVLIVDQFERALHASHDENDLNSFLEEVTFILRAERQLVKVVIVIRADWLLYLESAVENFQLPVSTFRVDYLTRDEARQAIIGPLNQLGMPFERRVIEDILDELLGHEHESLVEKEFIQPIHLQLVVDSICSMAEEETIDQAFKWEFYQRVGGVKLILYNYLSRTLKRWPDVWLLLARFIDGRSSRSLHQSELMAVPAAEEVEAEIQSLIAKGLIQKHEDKYRLTHDYLVGAVVAYLRDNPDKQGWKLAEDWLNKGTLEWRESTRLSNGEGLLLERNRYLHVYEYRDKLRLTDESRGVLIRTALRYGHEGLGDWLRRGHDLQADGQIVVDKLFSPELETRQAAQKAVIEAIRKHLLTDEHQRCLKKLLWKKFEDKEQPPRSDTAQLTKRERKESAATTLWALRKFTSSRQKRRFVPVVARAWVTDHKTPLVVSAVSVLLVLALVLASWVISESVRGKWYPMQTLFAGPVSAAAISPNDPDTVYVVTPRGPVAGDGATLLQRHGDDDWEILSRSFTRTPILSLLVTDSNGKTRIYVSAQGKGILRSDDNGKSWVLINVGLRSYSIHALIADPLNTDILYAGSGDARGVFESQDGGNSWQDISEDELFGASVLSMAHTPYEGGTLLAGTADGRIVARRRDEPTWKLVSAYPGLGSFVCMSAEPEKGDFVYAGTSTGKVLVSPNSGADWILLKEIRGVFSISSIVVVPGEPNVVYVDAFGIGGYIVWKSENNGQDWDHVSDDRFTREPIGWLSIPRQEPGKLYAAGQAGFFETRNGGDSWIFDESIGSPLAAVSNIAISPLDEGPTYVAVGGAVYYSLSPEAGGWARGNRLLALEVRDMVPDPTAAAVAYAGVYLPNKWSVFATMDGGETWQPTTSPPDIAEKYLNDTMALDVAKVDNGTLLYAGTNGCGVLHTADRGASWETWGRQDCSLPSSAPKNIIDLVIDPHSVDTLYVAADGTRVFVTTDRGRSWQSYLTPLTTEIAAIEADPEIKGRVYLIAGSDGFWRSDDGAKTWKHRSKGLEEKSLSAMVVVPDTAETLFVGATSGEVWKTTDGGEHWKPVRENLAVTNISTMAYGTSEQGIILGGGDGIYRYQPGSLPGP